MSLQHPIELTKAQESRAAIERVYIEMRHLFNSGIYKPSGASGQQLTDSLLTLRPEIYGSMNDPSKVELDGLVYVIERLPKGIEECRFIRLISEEGYHKSGFEVLIPHARKRNCYRIDDEQMFIEVTRGRSEIYDILTHLTFMYHEAEKIKEHAYDGGGKLRKEWLALERLVTSEQDLKGKSKELAFTYLSTLLGRTYEETKAAVMRLQSSKSNNNGLFHIVYWLGTLIIREKQESKTIEISFSPTLRQRIGHHMYGERWSQQINKYLIKAKLLDRPIHVISANLHSFLNTLYSFAALKESERKKQSLEDVALMLSDPKNKEFNDRVEAFASKNGLHLIKDSNGTNISAQVIDTAKINFDLLPTEIKADLAKTKSKKPVLIVFDYAFGEQAYEIMDELLKPLEENDQISIRVASINIMGKAGILQGGKGDIMIPTAHVFEGTADNYPIVNDFKASDFHAKGLYVCEGPMITVLGTSLQNKEVLEYFESSSWNAIGLEMEGAHYQKAIQSHAIIRNSISKDVVLRYAYYASDNPLVTGNTLASGSLGLVGVKPTYLITTAIINKIFQQED
ncbi:MAG: hypothetical protein RIE86_08190 [Imperialibacter sp.]|uniref:DUF6909 family protein n=1 Tax=Imperialibacter sp. TaxID=2038411 RepID=UPI0032EAECFC